MFYIALALVLTFTFGLFGTEYPYSMVLGLLWTILAYLTGEIDEISDYVRTHN